MINFAENLNKMITAGLGGETEAPRTEIAVGHRLQYLDASGPVAIFDTNIVAPLRKLLVTMLPIQAGSGGPSPENIRPISGRDSVTIGRSGKNLLKTDAVRGYPSETTSSASAKRKFDFGTYVIGLSSNNYYNESAITSFSYTDGKLVYTTSASGYGVGFVFALNPGMTVRFSAVFGIGSARVAFYDSEGNYLGFKPTNAPIVAPDGTKYAVLCIYTSQINTEISVENMQIEVGSTATDYEPGYADFTTVQLGDAVYGGTLDVTTGKLTVTAAYALLNDPDKWVEYSGAAATYQYTERYADREFGSRTVMASSAFPVFDTGIPLSIGWLNSNNSTFVGIVDSNNTISLSELKTLASSNGIEIVYALAEPVEIDLTPQQITTLIGDNNVWTDAGDVDVTYIYYEETEGY